MRRQELTGCQRLRSVRIVEVNVPRALGIRIKGE